MNLSARDGCPGKRFKDRCAVLRRGLIGSTLKSHDFLKRRSSTSSSSTKPASRLMNLVLDHDILPNGAAIIRPADGRTTIERLCGRSVEFGTERRPKAHLLFFVGIDCGCVPENGCILNGDAGWRAGRALTERIDGDTGAVAAVRPAAASAFGQR